MLDSELRAFAVAENISVAAENRVFSATGTMPYLAVSLMVSEEKAAALGAEAAEGIRGIYQITVVTASGIGPQRADGIKDSLARHFGRRRLDNGNGVSITVTRVRGRSGMPETEKYTLPVDVEFRAWANFY